MFARWEQGSPMVLRLQRTSEESGLRFWIGTAYLRLVPRLADIRVYEDFTGFGLYERRIIDNIKNEFRDPYAYFRGMIAEIILPHAILHCDQENRS
jgi:polyisoprenyl-phosphate glycosyltransferase